MGMKLSSLYLSSFALQLVLQVIRVRCACSGNSPAGTYFDPYRNCGLFPCQPGTYSSSSTTTVTACTQCPAGTYSAYTGDGCLQCPSGTYGASPGLASAADCTQCANSCSGPYGQASTCGGADPGSACVWCANAGTYDYYTSQGGYASTCVLGVVPAGTYRSIAYPRAPHTMTLRATTGTKDNVAFRTVGATFTYQKMVNSQPQFFGGGWYLWWWNNLWLFDTSSGFVGGNTATYFGPPYDRYAHTSGEQYLTQPLLDLSSNIAWYLPCAAGTYAPDQGMSSCLSCPVGTYAGVQQQTACTPCGVGTYMASTKATGCTVCPAGTFAGTTGSSACRVCPQGLAANSAGSSTCVQCPAGQYTTPSATCSACAAGTASNAPGTMTACPQCPRGAYAGSTGTLVCSLCPAGTYAAATGLSACTPCAVGTASGAQGATASCPLCPVGAYAATAGALACSVCPTGTYAGTAGLSACQLCAIGTYAGVTGLSACLPCAAGTYGASKGLSACPACTTPICSVGNYFTACTATSNIGCAPCPAVARCTYTSNVCTNAAGLPACSCAAGYYMSSAGGCAGCPAGKFSAIAGAVSSDTCATCPLGTTTRPGDLGMTTCTACALLNQALPLSAQWSSGGDALVCSWSCFDGYLRVNFSEATFVASSYTALSYPEALASRLFHVANDYCCNPQTPQGAGLYLSGCSRTSPGVATPCAPLLNGYYIDAGTSKLSHCDEWVCNAGYYATRTGCVAQPSCRSGFTYQRDAAGDYTVLANGSFVCAPCSRCMDGAQVLVPCNLTVDTQCVLCRPTDFSSGGGPCVDLPPYGFVGVVVQLTSLPPFQGRPLYLSDGQTPVDWSAIQDGGFFVNTFSPCQTVPEAYAFTGSDLPCRRRDTDPVAKCPITPCNTQCRAWNGSAGWFMLRGQCAPCVYDPTCTSAQYSDLSVCGPTSAPVCTPCPGAVPPNAVSWVNPGKVLPPGRPPCAVACKDGFQPSADGLCVPCPSLPDNAKITSGCSWACSLGFEPLGASACVPCAAVPASCPLGTYLGYPARSQCPRCLPCTNTVANSVFVSSGSVNGPNTCRVACNPGYYAGAASDAFGNPVTCSPCTQPQCAAGVSFIVPCSAAADAYCQPCSGCPIGYAVARPCTLGSNNTCAECQPNRQGAVLLPPGAAWSAPGCVQWECNAGFHRVAGGCAACKQPSDCAKSDRYSYSAPGCGACSPCNASLLLPFQCFNGDGQCGATYWCGWTTATSTAEPPTTTQRIPVATTPAPAAYASLITLTVQAGTPLQAILQSIVCESPCSVQVLSIATGNQTTYCSDGCTGGRRRRALLSSQQQQQTVTIGIITFAKPSAPPSVADTLQPIAMQVTRSYLVHNASLLSDASELAGFVRSMEEEVATAGLQASALSSTNVYIMASVGGAVALAALAVGCSVCILRQRRGEGGDNGSKPSRSQFRWDGVKIRLV